MLTTHQVILFIPGCDEIISGERTMQGSSAAATLHALNSLLLLDTVSTQNTKDAAYTDNLNCSSKLQECTIRWQTISERGPKNGFFKKRPN